MPPVSLCPPIPDLFNLSSDSRREIAAALGLPFLPPLLARTLEAGIARYRMQSCLPTVTVEENVAAIDRAVEALRVAESALLPFTNVSHSGVGIATVRALNPSACGVLASVGKFRTEALARKNELHRLPRLAAKHGALGWLGSLIRFVFEIVHEIIEA
jgi:hypothetical protein